MEGVGFDINSARRIGNATRAVERQQGSLLGRNLRRPMIGDSSTKLLISSNASVSTNIWKYTAKVGTWSVSGSSAPTFTTTGNNVTAYNEMEYGNSATGIQGNGVNMSNLSGSGYALVPIGNTVVEAEQIGVDGSGNPVYVFSAPNQDDGSCSSGGSGS